MKNDMETVSYCLICKDGKEHEVKKMVFFNRRIELTLDCGHIMHFYGETCIFTVKH